MHRMRSTDRNDLSSVLSKVDRILGAFDVDHPTLSLAELMRRTGLAKSTLHRLVGTLVDARLLERSDGQLQLGLRLFELGQLVPRQRALRDAALPFMEDLFEVTHETVQLGVRDGIEILYVEKIMGHRTVRSPSRVAGRMPLYCTAIGKAVLAFSPPEVLDRVIEAGLTRRTPYTIVAPQLLKESIADVARAGVAYDHEEAALGLCCAAAPVFGPRHALIGALSISGSTCRMEPEQMASAVKTASLSLSRVLAGGVLSS
jgi:IclR family transcriptional regulator, acetate operon repressor